jgi:hypothetical protein
VHFAVCTRRSHLCFVPRTIPEGRTAIQIMDVMLRTSVADLFNLRVNGPQSAPVAVLAPTQVEPTVVVTTAAASVPPTSPAAIAPSETVTVSACSDSSTCANPSRYAYSCACGDFAREVGLDAARVDGNRRTRNS